ncbi:MAG: non-hydrolyzing UDP-N-acetylglucosamine 2-epimerase [Sphingomonadaceae bacterium]
MGQGHRGHRHIDLVIGTRPEAIKIAPVARALANHRGIAQRIVVTGQHRGLESPRGVPVARLAVDPEGLSMAGLSRAIVAALDRLWEAEPPAMLLVQGDTTSALAAALAAWARHIPIGHVEAGLRSGDLAEPFPEEANRLAIDRMSALLFAPTERAAEHLARDPLVTGEIHLTGNSGIDALLEILGRSRPELSTRRRRSIYATCHRRENQNRALDGICAAMARLTQDFPVEIVFALHPNPRRREAVLERLGGVPHVRLVEPRSHEDSIALLQACWLVLTDSGGLQEEAATLGKPALVLRRVTERMEAVDSGNARLVGRDGDDIVGAVGALLRDPAAYARMARPSMLFGDGTAGPRIAAAASRHMEAIEEAAMAQALA